MKHTLSLDEIHELGNIESWEQFFTEEQYERWKALIQEKYSNGERRLLKKVLGVVYEPILDEIFDTEVLNQLELTDKSADYLTRVAYMLYLEDTEKHFGDHEVTEPLNYIEVDREDIASAYYETLED